MLDIYDILSAIDRGREEIAQCQYDIAKKSPVSGDPSIYDEANIRSIELSMHLEAVEILTDRGSVEDHRSLEDTIENIKALTKDLRKWD